MRRYLLRHDQASLPFVVADATLYPGEIPMMSARRLYRFNLTDDKGKTAHVEIDGRSHTVHYSVSGNSVFLLLDGFYYRLPFTDVRKTQATGQAALAVRTEIPGRIVKVLVKPGDIVRQNDPVIVQEAMKMEMTLRAPGDLRVASVQVSEGAQVEADALLVAFEELSPN